MSGSGVAFTSAYIAFDSGCRDWCALPVAVFSKTSLAQGCADGAWHEYDFGGSLAARVPVPSFMLGVGAAMGEILSDIDTQRYRLFVESENERRKNRELEEIIEKKTREAEEQAEEEKKQRRGWGSRKCNSYGNGLLASTLRKATSFAAVPEDKFRQSHCNTMRDHAKSLGNSLEKIPDDRDLRKHFRDTPQQIAKHKSLSLHLEDLGLAYLTYCECGRWQLGQKRFSELPEQAIENDGMWDFKFVPWYVEKARVSCANRQRFSTGLNADSIGPDTVEFIRKYKQIATDSENKHVTPQRTEDEVGSDLFADLYEPLVRMAGETRDVGMLKKQLQKLLQTFVPELADASSLLTNSPSLGGDNPALDLDVMAQLLALEPLSPPAKKQTPTAGVAAPGAAGPKRQKCVALECMPPDCILQLQYIALLSFVQIPFDESERDEAIAIYCDKKERAKYPILNALEGSEAFKSAAGWAQSRKQAREKNTAWIESLKQRHEEFQDLTAASEAIFEAKKASKDDNVATVQCLKSWANRTTCDVEICTDSETNQEFIKPCMLTEVDKLLMDFREMPEEVKSPQVVLQVEALQPKLRAIHQQLIETSVDAIVSGVIAAKDANDWATDAEEQTKLQTLLSDLACLRVYLQKVRHVLAGIKSCPARVPERFVDFLKYAEMSLNLRHQHLLWLPLAGDSPESLEHTEKVVASMGTLVAEWTLVSAGANFDFSDLPEFYHLPSNFIKVIEASVQVDDKARCESLTPLRVQKYTEFLSQSFPKDCVREACVVSFFPPSVFNTEADIVDNIEAINRAFVHMEVGEAGSKAAAMQVLLTASVATCNTARHPAVSMAGSEGLATCVAIIQSIARVLQTAAKLGVAMWTSSSSKLDKDHLLAPGAEAHLQILITAVANHDEVDAGRHGAITTLQGKQDDIMELFMPYLDVAAKLQARAKVFVMKVQEKMVTRLQDLAAVDRNKMEPPYDYLQWFSWAGDSTKPSWAFERIKNEMPGTNHKMVERFMAVKSSMTRLKTQMGLWSDYKTVCPSLEAVMNSILEETEDAQAYLVHANANGVCFIAPSGLDFPTEAEKYKALAKNARFAREQIKQCGAYCLENRIQLGFSVNEFPTFRFLTESTKDVLEKICVADGVAA